MAHRQYLSLRDVTHQLNCSASTLRRMLARGEFVQPLRLSGRILRWDSELVSQWMKLHATEKRGAE